MARLQIKRNALRVAVAFRKQVDVHLIGAHHCTAVTDFSQVERG